jgi:hypothetical protein
MDRWKQYLFKSHSEDTLRNWAKRLSLFRFFRAYGGHANDGDSLDVAYRYGNLGELEEFLRSLGVNVVIYRERPPQPEPGKAYPGDEFAKFPSLIPGTEWVRQPGHCTIAGQKVFIWCENDLVKISIGERYEVTEDDVAAAEEVEKKLSATSLERVDPPFDTNHYICPKYYPDYFG